MNNSLIAMRIAYSEDDAWDQVDKLAQCKNCVHYIQPDLFGARCGRIESLVDEDSTCECFRAKSKKIKYWIDKLVEMAQEYYGPNDFMRQWIYHEENGTAEEFLFNKKNKE